MNLRFTELIHRESLTPKFQKKILKSELIKWKSLSCQKYLQTKANILKRLEDKIQSIQNLHRKMSQKLLQLTDLFRELDFQETALQFKVTHGFNWKKELETFRKECLDGKKKPQTNAWQFGIQMSKQWSIFERVSSIILEKNLRQPVHLLRKTSESLDERTFAIQEQTNAEYIYEQKKLRMKKKKLLRSRGVKDWEINEMVNQRQKVIRGLEKGERWGWGVMCWEQSSLMRHLKGLFESSNSASFLQMENLQMLENSMIVKKFDIIKKLFKKNLKLLVDF